MRQAIVITNPKWEPFTKASDAFKTIKPKAGESAVLVVRGRCKEKNQKSAKSLASGKTAEWLKTQTSDVVDKVKKTASKLLAFAFVLCAFSASAQQEIKGNLYTTAITGTNTNDGAVMMWRPNEVFTLQSAVTTSTSDTNDVVITIDESLGAGYWTTSTKTITLDCASHTNGTVTLLNLTNNLGTLFWKFSSTAKVGTNTATVNSLLIYKADE